MEPPSLCADPLHRPTISAWHSNNNRHRKDSPPQCSVLRNVWAVVGREGPDGYRLSYADIGGKNGALWIYFWLNYVLCSVSTFSMNKLSKHIYISIYLYEKKENCLFKKENPKLLLYYVPNRKKQLSFSGLCLHYPGHIVKPSQKKSNERQIWQREKKKHKMASHWLHSVWIWPRFRYFTIRVYSQVIWNVCPYKYL